MILIKQRSAKITSILLCMAFICTLLQMSIPVFADEDDQTQGGGDVVAEGYIGTPSKVILPDEDLLLSVYFDGKSALAVSATFEYPTDIMTYNGYECKVDGFSLSVTQRSGENGIGYLDVFGFSEDLVTSLNGIIPVIDLNFHISKDAEEGASICLKMMNATASDGEKDYPLSDLVYLGKVSLYDTTQPAATGIKINGKNLDGFSAEITQYSLKVEFSVTSLTVEVLCREGAVASVKGNENLVVGENNVFVEVVTENENKYTYTIKVERLADPDRVISTDASLADIKLSKGFVTPSIDKNVLDYVIYLPANTTELTIEPIPTDERAVSGTLTVEVGSDVNKSIKLSVTAEDGSVLVYTFTVLVLPEYVGQVPVIGGEQINISDIDFGEKNEENGLYLKLPENTVAFLKKHGIGAVELLAIVASAVLVLVALIVVLLVLLKTKKKKKRSVVYVEDAIEGAGFIEKNGAVISDDDIESDVF